MTTIKITRSPRPGVVGVHEGRSVESIGRRLFGRQAEVSYSADPHAPQHGMYVRRLRDGGGWDVLAEFRVWDA